MSMTRRVSKGITNNNSGTKFTWWKTNFNMPVPNILDDLSGWTQYTGPFTYTGADTSFSLVTFYPGYEIVAYSCIYDWTNTTGSSINLDEDLYSYWVDTDFSTVLVGGYNGNITMTLADGYWKEYMYVWNIGVAGWEIDSAGDYYVKAKTIGNYSMAEVSTTINFSTVPDTTQLDSDKYGYIWVEDHQLCYVNANGWVHRITGIDQLTTPGENYVGSIWIDEDNNLHWIGDDGEEYIAPWKVKQFASSFSGGPTKSVDAGGSKAGYIWVDNEFGYTHLSYIGYDGWKYLIGAGDNPYA